MDNDYEKLLYANFNDDSSVLYIGTSKGFKLIDTHPFKDSLLNTNFGGISIIEPIGKTGFIAVVGSNTNKINDNTKIIIWDHSTKRTSREFYFKTQIKHLKSKSDKLIVVCINRISLLNLTNSKIIDSFEIFDNPKGIFGICSNPFLTVMSYPDKNKGCIFVRLYDINKINKISAYENEISNISLNYEGTLLAVASENGNEIRIFNSFKGEFIYELRRGHEKAIIYSICFSLNSKYLACSSNRYTIHIYSLYKINKKIKEELIKDNESITFDNTTHLEGLQNIDEKDDGLERRNNTSILSFIKKIFPIKYLSSEWSFAKLKVKGISYCSFGMKKNSILALSLTKDNKLAFQEGIFDTTKGGEPEYLIEHGIMFLGK